MDKREDTGNYYPGGTVVTGTPVPAPGGGSSIEVVEPSPDGAGKAADAKAVYEGLEEKRGKTDLAVYAEQVSKPQALADECLPILSHGASPFKISNDLAYDGCIRVWETEPAGLPDIVINFSEEEGDDGVSLVVEAAGYIEYVSGAVEYVTFGGKPFKAGEWPRLKSSVAPSAEKILTSADVVPLAPTEDRSKVPVAQDVWNAVSGLAKLCEGIKEGLSATLSRYPFKTAAIVDGGVTVAPYTNAKLESDGTAFEVAVGGESGYMRDCVLRVECGEAAPTITWSTNFHPRTDAATDFACVAGVRNVYWITEHAPGEFTVAGWQETEGGNA